MTHRLGSYTEDDIKVLERLAQYRRTPMKFIPDQSTAGLLQLYREVGDNGADELLPIGPDGLLEVCLFQDHENKNFQLIVRDNGRGIPLGKLLTVTTFPSSSGKFESGAFTASAGQFGDGLKVTAALSNRFRAISSNDGRHGSVFVSPSYLPENTDVVESTRHRSGVTIAYEPDPNVFSNLYDFAQTDFNLIINHLSRYSYFYTTRIIFYLSVNALPDIYWQCNANDALNMIDNMITDKTLVEVFNSTTFDRNKWIKQAFGSKGNYEWSMIYRRPIFSDPELKLGFDTQLFFCREDNNFGKIGLVNGVPIDRGSSFHLSTTRNILKKIITPLIESDKLKVFFNESNYTLPIHMAVAVRFAGAKLTGTMKDNFVMPEFQQVYGDVLERMLMADFANITLLYSYIKPHLESKYKASINQGQKEQRRLFTLLKSKFDDATHPDRHICELFLVEGQSAGNDIQCDTHQAIYFTRGKMFNPLKQYQDLVALGSAQHKDIIKKLMANDIYHDIMRIVNIDPLQPNLDKHRFDKIIFCSDADPHGAHITATGIAGLYYLCPQLIDEGKIYVALPPLYGVSLKESKSKPFYFRDEGSYLNWMVNNLYSNAIEFFIEVNRTKELIPIRDDSLLDFIKTIMAIGDEIELIAKELVITPISLVERLAYITPFLDKPNLLVKNLETIRLQMGVDKVDYEPGKNILIISIANNDYTIPLFDIAVTLKRKLYPMLSRILIDEIQPYIKTPNHTFANKLPVPISIYNLYELLNKLRTSNFNVKRFKGIGEMGAENIRKTCIDPTSRTLLRISSMNSIQTVFDIFGGASDHRKSMVSGYNQA